MPSTPHEPNRGAFVTLDRVPSTGAGAAVVTGGGRGIGAAIVVALARAGFDVAIVSSETEAEAGKAIDEARRFGGKVRYLQHDIASVAEHGGVVEQIGSALGPVRCLVNNAGVSSLKRGDLLNLSVESFDRSLGVNLRGTFFFTQAVANRMLGETSTRETQPYRSIVTITSANVDIIGVDRADYCMSKAALSMMSRLYATRLASSRIHVFEVRPGIIRTEMTRPATEKYDDFIARGGVPQGRWGAPEDVGTTVASIAEGRLPFTTGDVINVGGGLHLHRV
jgi:3-oxoacyl-[acyl-carrier protein] reductase